MNIIYRQVEGTQDERPLEFEQTESTIYLRKNIEKTEKTSKNGTTSMWKYDEAKLTPDEYTQYASEISMINANEMIMQAISDLQADITLIQL
jgi:hypothetical protein